MGIGFTVLTFFLLLTPATLLVYYLWRSAEDALERLRADNTGLRNTYERELTKKQDHLKALEAECRKLSEQIKAEVLKVKEWRGLALHRQDLLSAAQGQCNALEESLAQKDNHILALGGKVSALETEVSHRSTVVEGLQRQVHDLQGLLDKVFDDVAQWKKSYDSAKEELSKARSDWMEYLRRTLTHQKKATIKGNREASYHYWIPVILHHSHAGDSDNHKAIRLTQNQYNEALRAAKANPLDNPWKQKKA